MDPLDRVKRLGQPSDTDTPALREAKARLVALTEARVTDDGLKAMIPMFVKGKAGADHKCGGCQFRMGTGGCAIVFGTVSFPSGVCSYWADGKPGVRDHDGKMTKADAGYIEVAHGVRVVCSSCARYARGESFCKLWDGDVDPDDCCMSYKPSSMVMAEKK